MTCEPQPKRIITKKARAQTRKYRTLDRWSCMVWASCRLVSARRLHHAHRADHQLVGGFLLLVAEGRVERVQGLLERLQSRQMRREHFLLAIEPRRQRRLRIRRHHP